ncbi:MAG TPA: sulfatase [Verrucomicrobiae bacterium]
MKRNLLCALASLLCAVSAFAAKQPNILFIFSDDHAYQAISAYNDPRKLNETSNIDRLAKEGMIFHRAMVPNSICGPSRATVLTGKYNHLNGFYNNSNSKFDPAQPTFVKQLHAAGYQTAIVGKWHLISDPVGFDYWKVLPGQGVYYNPAMIDNGKQVKLEGYTTDLITDITLDWLKQRDKTKPFLMMCQHKAPHREWEPNLKYLGWDHDRKYPEPETLFDNYSDRGPAVADQDMTIEKTMTPRDTKLVTPGNLTPEQKKVWDAYYEPRNEKFRKDNPQGKDLVRWRYNRYMHDYLGCIKSVDESVGRLLDYLKQEGLEKDTLVVYSADQGFYLGEHGWFDKRWIFEESLRTPLLIRWPGVTKPGSSSERIVSNLDFAETFLDAAGLPVPADMQGRSLVPILKGQTPNDWRTSFYYHYYEFPTPHHVRPHYGVVTDQYKLVHFYKPDVDYWELYDRKKDPLEVHNFYNDTAYTKVVADLKEELRRLRVEVKETGDPPRAAYGNKAFDNEPQSPEAPKKKGAGKKKAQLQ